ncbi:hypothetical protein [Niabella hibiscisoli]|uniref:hypothetical protein n=1 Tax=Niabella hibiscisoli TaxID=1825928 RepID=UPI001F10032F|nr:hypothetical protein [Niabella hibiscisoli]MCH5719769.1 hypothetical protein [Niabella hibiscisoli]
MIQKRSRIINRVIEERFISSAKKLYLLRRNEALPTPGEPETSDWNGTAKTAYGEST